MSSEKIWKKKWIYLREKTAVKLSKIDNKVKYLPQNEINKLEELKIIISSQQKRTALGIFLEKLD